MKERNLILSLLLFFIFFSGIAQNDTLKTDMNFDLGLTRNWDVDAWPLLKIKRSVKIREFQFLWPMYKYEYNLLSNEKFNRFLPFYILDSTKEKVDLRIGTLFFPSIARYSILKERKIWSFRLFELAPEINFLEISRSKDGLFVQNNAFFFLWHKNDLLTKKSHFIVFPVYWQFDSPQKSSKTLFPLYTNITNYNDSSRFMAITPLYYHSNYCRGSTNTLFPLFWNRNDSITSFNIFFPLLWHIENKRYQSFTFFPFFSQGESPDKTRNHLTITPVYWNLQNKKNKTSTLFPLFWHVENGTGENKIVSDIIFPFYWHDKDKLKESYTVLPIIFYNKSKRYSSLTLLPFYSVGQSPDSSNNHLMISPLYWKFKNHDYTFNTFFPIYWSYLAEGRKIRVLFPLIWNFDNDNSRTFSIFPLFSISHSEYLSRSSMMITPFFRHIKDLKKENYMLFPIYFGSRHFFYNDTSSLQAVFPCFFHFIDKTRRTTLLFPVIWSFKNVNHKSFTFIPFFSRGQSNDALNKHLVLTPLFWYFKSPESESYSLFPFWWNRVKENSENPRYFNVVFPFYWTFHNRDQNTNIIFPLSYSYRSNNRNNYTFFPLFSFGKNSTKSINYFAITPFYWNLHNKKGKTTTLFPFLWNMQRYVYDDTISRTIFFPVFWHMHCKWQTNTIFFPILWDLKGKHYQSFSFIPFFSVGRTPDKQRRHFVLSPAFWQFKSENASSTTLLPFFHASRVGNGENEKVHQVLFPVFYHFKELNVQNITIFPIFWFRDNEKYKSITLFPFYSTFSSKDGSFRRDMISPLFWRTEGIDKSSILFLPLYYGVKKSDKHFRLFFPVYYSMHKPQIKKDIIFPVFYRLQNKQYSSTTFFPFFSYGKSPDAQKRHIVLSPIYWKFSTGNYTRSTLIPLYMSSKIDDNNKSFSLFYFLLRFKKQDQLKTLAFLWPLCQIESNTNYKYFRLTPVIWYKRSTLSSYFSIQPLFYFRTDSSNSVFNLFWLVYQQKNRFGIGKSHGLLWRTVYWENYLNHDHEFRLLHLLVTHINKEGYTERSFFPFYRKTETIEGERAVSAGLFFYNLVKKKIPGSNEFYQEEKLFWLVRVRSNIKSLEQKGIIKPGEKLKF